MERLVHGHNLDVGVGKGCGKDAALVIVKTRYVRHAHGGFYVPGSNEYSVANGVAVYGDGCVSNSG